MKKLTYLFLLCLLTSLTFGQAKLEIEGAWKANLPETQGGIMNAVMTIADGYSFFTMYDVENKKFIGSQGGLLTDKGNGKYGFEIEFSTMDENMVGTKMELDVTIDGSVMKATIAGTNETSTYDRIDNGNSEMFGAWRITDRMRNGEMSAMRQGSRKTIKMLTGTRFQWAAYDPATKRFSGTGGGTYTMKDGKYTEHIEFFSRNADRVGASLTFDYKIDGKKWDHSGLSSTGNPIREIWTRQN